MVRSKSEVDKLHIDKLEKIISTGLNILKSKVDKLHHKLVPVPVDLSKLGDVVKTDLVKKDTYIYNANINNSENKTLDINNLATNINLKAKKDEVKNEVPSITDLAKTAGLNAKINEVKNKIPVITNLTTNTALAAVENKIPDYNKYITTQ